MTPFPAVTVVVPVLNEEQHLCACLDSIVAQVYPGEVEILVVDGGSVDRSRSIAASYPQVRLLENPRRLQSAGLNIALAVARGQVFVRVDGHSTIAPDFVRRSVETLQRTGAAMVGAGLQPRKDGRWLQRSIAAAIVSPLGAGPAAFRRRGSSRWVDTAFLTSFWTSTGRDLGGYDEDTNLNEDAEFAYRMATRGGVWYEETLVSTYVGQGTLRGLTRQYYRYGRLRAGMVRRHPESLAARQLIAPLFLAALLSRKRRFVLLAYAGFLAGVAWRELPDDPAAAAGLVGALPCMHVPWAVGFLAGLTRGFGVGLSAFRQPGVARRSEQA